MKIKGRGKKRGYFLVVVGIVVGLLAMWKGINGAGLTVMICGILLAAVCCYRLDQEADEEGVSDISVIFWLIKFRSKWKWEQMSYMFADYERVKPDVAIIMRKGNGAKKFVVRPEDVQQIVDWAGEANESLPIEHNGDVDLKIKKRKEMTPEQYAAAKQARHEAQVNPGSISDAAKEARRLRSDKSAIKERAERELLLRKPDMSKVKVKKPSAGLKSFR